MKKLLCLLSFLLLANHGYSQVEPVDFKNEENPIMRFYLNVPNVAFDLRADQLAFFSLESNEYFNAVTFDIKTDNKPVEIVSSDKENYIYLLSYENPIENALVGRFLVSENGVQSKLEFKALRKKVSGVWVLRNNGEWDPENDRKGSNKVGACTANSADNRIIATNSLNNISNFKSFQRTLKTYINNPEAFAILCNKEGVIYDKNQVGDINEETFNTLKTQGTWLMFRRYLPRN